MRFLAVVFSLICMAFTTVSAAKADRRVAFVVGNGAYKNVAQLPNPPIDAKAMAGVLRNVGFDVVEGTNLTRDKMTEKLLDFGKKAQGADVAVFFYAGHGIEASTNFVMGREDVLTSFLIAELGFVGHQGGEFSVELFGDVDDERGSNVVVERGIDDLEGAMGREGSASVSRTQC